MARTATGVILAIIVIALASAAAYVAYQRTVQPAPVVTPAGPPPRTEAPALTPASQSPPPQPQPQSPATPEQPLPTQPAPQPKPPEQQTLVFVPDGTLGQAPLFNQSLGGIAIDRQRDLLIAVGDRGFMWFDLKTGKLAGRQNSTRENLSVSVDPVGAIYIGQIGRAEKLALQPDGRWARQFKIGEGMLKRVTAVAAVGKNILCADSELRGIVVFDTAGQPANRRIPAGNIALVGGPPAQVRVPNDTLDFAIDAAGQIVMAHPGKHSVETYDINGKRLTEWGRYSTTEPDGFPGCCNPTNLTTVPMRLLGKSGAGQAIITAEKGPPRVKVYDQTGRMLALIGQEHFDSNNRQMYVAADGKGRIYVADTEAKTIRRFVLKN